MYMYFECKGSTAATSSKMLRFSGVVIQEMSHKLRVALVAMLDFEEALGKYAMLSQEIPLCLSAKSYHTLS